MLNETTGVFGGERYVFVVVAFVVGSYFVKCASKVKQRVVPVSSFDCVLLFLSSTSSLYCCCWWWWCCCVVVNGVVVIVVIIDVVVVVVVVVVIVAIWLPIFGRSTLISVWVGTDSVPVKFK